MKRILLIDGYNVMLRDSTLRAVYRDNQEIGRRTLLEMVSRYARRKSLKCTVVFDGGDKESGSIERRSPPGVEAIFVTDADSYIRRKVSNAGSTESLTVISSDEDHIARFSRGMGINVRSAEEFMCDLRATRGSEAASGEKPAGETKAGVEYWLKEFKADEGEEE